MFTEKFLVSLPLVAESEIKLYNKRDMHKNIYNNQHCHTAKKIHPQNDDAGGFFLGDICFS